MKKLLGVGFEDFCQAATAHFDDRFNEWHVTFFRFDYFHFFSRSLSENQSAEVLVEAFDYLQLIARHAGQLNISGAFVEDCEMIKVFERQGLSVEITLAYSMVLKCWFWGRSFWNLTTGGGFAPGLWTGRDSEGVNSRAEALLEACQYLSKDFAEERMKDTPQHAANARLVRQNIENLVSELLAQNKHLPIPSFFQKPHLAVQISLF